jgi:hypothetical protein
MTFKKDEKTGRTRIENNTLQNSNYDFGFQNKKIERQSIKGLSPKYCYATNTTPLLIANGATASFTIDSYNENDIRFKNTADTITVPQAWLWLITFNPYIVSDWGWNLSGTVTYRIKRNGNESFWLLYGRMNKYITWTNFCNDMITFSYQLDQGDEISLTIENDFWVDIYLDDLSTLSIISYVLF